MNELDFEKLEAECRVETNTIYGNPVGLHSQRHDLAADLFGSYHVYVNEWTPEYLLWTVDGVEIRRETGDVVQAYAQNSPDGMQFRFNVWTRPLVVCSIPRSCRCINTSTGSNMLRTRTAVSRCSGG